VRIDGPESLGGAHISGNAPRPLQGAKRASSFTASDEPALSSQLQAESAEYLPQALAAREVNLDAVAEAKRLIESGALETPEAARRAAEAILKFGL